MPKREREREKRSKQSLIYQYFVAITHVFCSISLSFQLNISSSKKHTHTFDLKSIYIQSLKDLLNITPYDLCFLSNSDIQLNTNTVIVHNPQQPF